MKPTIFGVIGPGFLNQVPTLYEFCLRAPLREPFKGLFRGSFKDSVEGSLIWEGSVKGSLKDSAREPLQGFRAQVKSQGMKQTGILVP